MKAIGKIRKMTVIALSIVLMLMAPAAVRAEETLNMAEGTSREVEVEQGGIEYTENRTMHALESVIPDMSLRPSTKPWVSEVTNLWGNGITGVRFIDHEYVDDEENPYTLVNNGLVSRITVQFNNIIPRIAESVDPHDPMYFERSSIDVPGQYKLVDDQGNVYYCYCCDAATDVFAGDTYNGYNVEEGGYYSDEFAEHIRYICINGYWGCVSGVGSLDYFRDFLVDNGVLTADQAAALTHGEALTATQAAIWKFGNRDLSFSVDEDIVVGPALDGALFSSANWDWRDDYIANDGNSIKRIYAFLIKGTISPDANTIIMNRSNSLGDVDVTVRERVSEGPAGENDVYKADLDFKVVAAVSDSHELEVTVSQDDDTVATVPLVTGQDSYGISDLELTENSEITLDITGSRELNSGVYIFKAKNGEESQTLVGVAAGTQNVAMKRSVTFRVTYSTECQITGEKILEHGELEGGQFSFELIGPDGKTIETVKNDDEGKITFTALQFTTTDLDLTDENGCITYKVKEVVTDAENIIFDSEEKTVKIKLTFDGDSLTAVVADDSDDLTFVNKVSKTDIEVVKIWEDNDDEYKMRPVSITVHLLADGQDTGESVILSAENDWSGKFTDLPIYDGENEIDYSVSEDEVEGYVPEIQEDAEIFVITNYYHYETPPTGDRDSIGYWLMLFSAVGLTMDISWMSDTTRRSRREEN